MLAVSAEFALEDQVLEVLVVFHGVTRTAVASAMKMPAATRSQATSGKREPQSDPPEGLIADHFLGARRRQHPPAPIQERRRVGLLHSLLHALG